MLARSPSPLWRVSCRTYRQLAAVQRLPHTVTAFYSSSASSSPWDGMDAQKAINAGWDNGRVVRLTPRDCILYALGIGAEAQTDLKYTYERCKDFTVFPSLPTIWSFCGSLLERVVYDQSMPLDMISQPYTTPIVGFPKINTYNFLDAERFIELYQPIKPDGIFRVTSRHVNIIDKRVGCIVETEHIVTTSDNLVIDLESDPKSFYSPGDPRVCLPPEEAPALPGKDPHQMDEKVVARILTGCFVKGLSGFDSAGTATGLLGVKHPFPERPPDYCMEQKTSFTQPALYRLGSGDYNPLHIDNDIAARGGLAKPIMHGLCTLGFACRHVLSLSAGNEPTKCKALKARFAAPVPPGSTLVTEVWESSDNPVSKGASRRVYFSTRIKESNKVVINHAFMEFTS